MTKTLKFALAFLAMAFCFTACSGDDEDETKDSEKSNASQITSFKFTNPTVDATIDQENKTIIAELPEGTEVTALAPTIVVSDKATVFPASGEAQDFSKVVKYQVTAEDGSTTVYSVTVSVKGGNVNVTDPQSLNGTIDQHTTLKDLGLPIDYLIDGTLYVDGNATLTIEPGVTIAFSSSTSNIYIGGDCGLVMKATQDNPIIFRGVPTNPGSGAWGRILLDSNRKENVWEYVEFINGGSGDEMVAIGSGAKVTIKNCTFKGSDSDAIRFNDDCEVLACENNIFEDNTRYPIVIEDLRTLNTFADNTYKDNGKNMINVNNGGYWIEKDKYTIKNHGIPYYLLDGIGVSEEGTNMNIEKGVTFIVNESKGIEVHQSCKLSCLGTETEPITFKGAKEDEYWYGLDLRCNKSDAIKLENVIISEGGYAEDGQALYLTWDATGAIKNLKIENSNAYGVRLENRGEETPRMTTENVTFEKCRLGNVYDETDYTRWNEEKGEDEVVFAPGVYEAMPF